MKLADRVAFSVSRSDRLIKHGARYWRIPLYSNAFYLMLGNGLGALLGIVFWAVAAHFYTTDAVGLIAAAIAAMAMLGSLSNLGLGIGLIRFLPGSGERTVPRINYSLTIVILLSILLSVIFLLGLGTWSPALIFFRRNAAAFIVFAIFTAATAITGVIDSIFVALRHAGFVTARGLLFTGLKLVLAIMLAGVSQAYGIFNSWGAALCVSLILSFFLFLPNLIHGYLPMPNLNWRGTGELMRYSLVNNLANLLAGLPGQLLPMMLLSRLGAQANAYFYVAWQIMAALLLIPFSISTSLFAEGCHDERELMDNAWRSLGLALAILVPLAIVIIVFSAFLLRIFGAAYAQNSSGLLQVLALSLFPVSVNQVFFTILRVQKRLKLLTALNGLIALAALLISYLLLPAMGTLGAGVGWLAGQGLAALWIIIGQGRNRMVWQKLSSLLSREVAEKNQEGGE